MTLLPCKEIIFNAAEFFHINVADNILIYQREIENMVRQTLPRTSTLAQTQTFDIIDYYSILPCQSIYIDDVRVQGTSLRLVSYLSPKYPEKTVYKIEVGKLRFKYETEQVEIDYRGLPTDKEGFLMIPDIAELSDMLKYVVLFTYLSGGKTHPAFNLSTTAGLINQKQILARQKGNGWSEADLLNLTKVVLDTTPIYNNPNFATNDNW